MRTPLTKEERTFWRRVIRIYAKLGFFVFVLLLSSGCTLGGKQTYIVRQYLLEYPPPAVEGLIRRDELIRVDRFLVAQAFNSPSMIYRESPFNYQGDPYNRWRVNPGAMVTDYLLRDLRKVDLFRGVYSGSDIESTRYVLDGTVEQFLGFSDQEGSKALLGLSVTFLDTAKKEMPQKVIFQREYRYTEPLAEKTPAGFAEAMSRAMEKFSRQLITDLARAIQR